MPLARDELSDHQDERHVERQVKSFPTRLDLLLAERFEAEALKIHSDARLMVQVTGWHQVEPAGCRMIPAVDHDQCIAPAASQTFQGLELRGTQPPTVLVEVEAMGGLHHTRLFQFARCETH